MQVQSLCREDPLEEDMQPTPLLLPRKSHGQRSMVQRVTKRRMRMKRLSKRSALPAGDYGLGQVKAGSNLSSTTY